MSATAATLDSRDAAEAHRQRMLAESDELLDRVERLRMAGRASCPADLGDAVRSLHLRLGRVPAERPRTVRAAHQMVFSAQSRLMAANPRHGQPRPLPGRPRGVPRLTLVRRGAAWKFLSLPPPPPAADPAAVVEWQHLVRLTVARALDRWVSAQDQAVRAARSRQGAVVALHRARAAWRNYWELCCEAERLVGRVDAVRHPGPVVHVVQPAPDRCAASRPQRRPADAPPRPGPGPRRGGRRGPGRGRPSGPSRTRTRPRRLRQTDRNTPSSPSPSSGGAGRAGASTGSPTGRQAGQGRTRCRGPPPRARVPCPGDVGRRIQSSRCSRS